MNDDLISCIHPEQIPEFPEGSKFLAYDDTVLDRLMLMSIWDNCKHAEEIGLLNIMPCCLIMCDEFVSSFTRADVNSCLVGGQIQETDLHWWRNRMAQGGPDVLWSALARELKEQIDLELLMKDQVEPVGFVQNDESVGIVFLFPLPEPITANILINRWWLPIQQLQEQKTLDPWSQTIIDELCLQPRFIDYAQKAGVRSSYGRPLF